MKSVSEMLTILMNKKHEGDVAKQEKAIEDLSSPKWKDTKKIIMGIPSEIFQALNCITTMQGVEKYTETHGDTEIKRYTTRINGFEMIFELGLDKNKKAIRAWITLYDNPNSLCFLRNLMAEAINKM
jgi:hypothetical protein